VRRTCSWGLLAALHLRFKGVEDIDSWILSLDVGLLSPAFVVFVAPVHFLVLPRNRVFELPCFRVLVLSRFRAFHSLASLSIIPGHGTT
jgi:hypothetical protein